MSHGRSIHLRKHMPPAGGPYCAAIWPGVLTMIITIPPVRGTLHPLERPGEVSPEGLGVQPGAAPQADSTTMAVGGMHLIVALADLAHDLPIIAEESLT
jgi:hypothetical protein